MASVALVVDDNVLVRRTISHYLSELGFDVLEAADAREGVLAAAGVQRLDLAVIDVVLPGGRGPDVAAGIRALHGRVPVMLISASPRPGREGPSWLDRHTFLLNKPFPREDFVDAVEQLTAGPGPTAIPALPTEPVVGGRPLTVLLVDTNDDARAANRERLERTGYVVLEAASGAEALEVCLTRGGSINLVVTDVDLPDVAPSALAIEAMRRCPSAGIIFVAGRRREDTKAPVGALGPRTGVVHKPLRPDDLAVQARKVLPS